MIHENVLEVHAIKWIQEPNLEEHLKSLHKEKKLLKPNKIIKTTKTFFL